MLADILQIAVSIGAAFVCLWLGRRLRLERLRPAAADANYGALQDRIAKLESQIDEGVLAHPGSEGVAGVALTRAEEAVTFCRELQAWVEPAIDARSEEAMRRAATELSAVIDDCQRAVQRNHDGWEGCRDRIAELEHGGRRLVEDVAQLANRVDTSASSTRMGEIQDKLRILEERFADVVFRLTNAEASLKADGRRSEKRMEARAVAPEQASQPVKTRTRRSEPDWMAEASKTQVLNAAPAAPPAPARALPPKPQPVSHPEQQVAQGDVKDGALKLPEELMDLAGVVVLGNAPQEPRDEGLALQAPRMAGGRG